MMRVSWQIAKTVVLIILFLLALSFEDAATERLTALVSIFTVLLAWGFIRYGFSNKAYLFTVDILLVLLLEYHSKFLINYFFHSMYIVLVLEAGVILARTQGNIVNLAISVAALGKFFWSLAFQVNARTISELLFNLFALAFLMTLTNYSRLQKEEKQTNLLLYQELLAAHQTLKHYSQRVEETSMLEERTRIAREIHDTIGHDLTSLIIQLEVLKTTLEQHTLPSQIHRQLEQLLASARQGLKDTRQAVNALKGNEYDGISGIKKLVNQFNPGNYVQVHLETNEINLAPEESFILYRAIQEGLTNSLRHGKATQVYITIKLEAGRLCWQINDNGSGAIQEPHAGFGLTNMRQRMEELGGGLQVEKLHPFTLVGSFPLQRSQLTAPPINIIKDGELA
jgi:signal transduction histidine kinase